MMKELLPSLVGLGLAVVLWLLAEFLPRRGREWLLPFAVGISLLAIWDASCVLSESAVTPTPLDTWYALGELVQSNRLPGDIAASLFRVTWGFLLAAAVGIPLGLLIGWSTRGFQALNPIVQGLRPISPIAWIPFAIGWFGIDDSSGVFLIFLATFFPITVGTTAAVRNISRVHRRSAQNFGVRGIELFRSVVLPAALPQIITSLRIALGVAWLVIVAAEMVGMNSGLGYLINDARNAGARYDLVAATMLVIGAIGIVLDFLIRRLETFDEVRWGYEQR